MGKFHITRPCSGCFETVDGQVPSGWYKFDKKAGCYRGAGCTECGYTGKRRWVYDTRDFEVMDD